MPWIQSIEHSPNHWFINFILNAKIQIHDFVYDNSRLLLQQTQDYTPIQNIAIYRVYKDKFDRPHYFTLSSGPAIIQLAEDLNLGESDISRVTDINRPNHRVLKLTCNQQFIYCLPQVNVIPGTRMQA